MNLTTVFVQCLDCEETTTAKGVTPVASRLKQSQRDSTAHIEHVRGLLLEVVDRADSIVARLEGPKFGVSVSKAAASDMVKESGEYLSFVQDYKNEGHLSVVRRQAVSNVQVLVEDGLGRPVVTADLPMCGYCNHPILETTYRCPRPVHRNTGCQNHYYCVEYGMSVLWDVNSKAPFYVDTEHCAACESSNVTLHQSSEYYDDANGT